MLLRTCGGLTSVRVVALWLLLCSYQLHLCLGKPRLLGRRQLVSENGVYTAAAVKQYFDPVAAPTISNRLVYRVDDIVKYWNDREVTCLELEDTVYLDEAAWHADFAATGGVAKLGQTGGGRRNLTITSACHWPAPVAQLPTWQLLSFGHIPDAVLVESGAVLTLRGLVLADFASSSAYQQTAEQPWRIAGVGFPLWTSIVLEPNATLVLQDVGIKYENPSQWDTCEQYNQRVLYALQQQYGVGNISAVNATAGIFSRPTRISVLVYGANSEANKGTSAGNKSSDAQALFSGVVFNCVPPQERDAATTGHVRVLVAAIVAPVGGFILLAALLYCCCRKWRCRRPLSAESSGAASKDVQLENRHLQNTHPEGRLSLNDNPDQHRVLAVPCLQNPQGAAGNLSVSDMRSSTHAGGSSSRPQGAATPDIGARALHAGSSEELSEQYSASDQPHPAHMRQTLVSGQLTACSSMNVVCSSSSARGNNAADIDCAPLQTVPHASPSQTGAQGSLLLQGPISHAAAAIEAAAGPPPSRYTITHHAALENDLGFTACHDVVRPSPAAAAGGTPHSTSSTCDTAGSPGGLVVGVKRSSDSRAGSATTSGRCSAAGSAEAASAVTSGATNGGPGSNSCSLVAGSSVNSKGADAQDTFSRDVPALLKARSDMAVLRDLKLGPLLGRGSYGGVYKGRWKSVTVAVKIIEHSETAASGPGSAARVMDVGRESLVATSIAHPNVVQTYHISTMTTAQRNALAATWLQEGASSNLAASQLAATSHPEMLDVERSADSNSSSSSAEAEQKDVLETWMLMEFCEKGSLERALSQGRFVTRVGQPEMIGIYKALLDTASGLDYLHTIGIVHGDLKTANVLLKGSTRDVRGFACKITDFGLSRVLDLDATHISTRTYGTIVYMPAELLLTGRMTQATDIYSFGLMMWELYTSSRVYDDGLSIGQMFYMIAYQGWRPVIPEDCPPGYAALMQACWHQDAEQRPTAQQVLRALQKLYVAQKRSMAAAKQAATVAPQNSAASAGASCAVATPPAAPQQAGPTSGRLGSDSVAPSQHPLASVTDRSRQQWGSPAPAQQLQPPPAVLPVRHLRADAGIPMQVIREAAALGAPTGSDEEIPTGQLFPGTYQSYVGAGSSGTASTETGSGRPSGSGGPDEYQPWARAVSMQAAPAAGSDMQSRQPSRSLQDGNWSLAPVVAAQPGARWQRTTGAGDPSCLHNTTAGLVGNVDMNQQPLSWHQPPSSQPLPADRYQPTLQLLELDLDGQSAMDTEQIPTESLFQNVSSASNICNTMSGSVLFSGTEDDAGQDDEVLGFLQMAPGLHHRTLQPTAAALRQHTVQQHHHMMAEAAAQDFVEALTMASSARPGYGAAGTGGNTGQLLSMSQYQAAGLPSHSTFHYGSAGTGTSSADILAVTADAGAVACLPYASENLYSDSSNTQPLCDSSHAGSNNAVALGSLISTGAPLAWTSHGGSNLFPALPSTPQEGQQQAAGPASDSQCFKTTAAAAAAAEAPVAAVGLPPPGTRAGWPSPAASPFAQHSLAARSSPPAVLAASGAPRRSSTPERSSTPPRPLFVYRTPSGRAYIPNPTTGVPQTVREGSGTTTGTSTSGPDSLRLGSVGSGTVSLHPAGSTAYAPGAAALAASQQGTQHIEHGNQHKTRLEDHG